MSNTRKHEKAWAARKIDWNASYLDGIDPVSGQPMWNHPHRAMLIDALSSFRWMSLIEVGVGAGANLKKILHHFKSVYLAGVDVNPDAVAFCKETFKGAHFFVGSADNIMSSENSADVVLSDATLLYYGSDRIKKALKEMIEVSRGRILLCELHSTNWLERTLYRLKTGYNVHDYKKLLEEFGCYDIQIRKIPQALWPGEPWAKFGHVILARIAKI